MSCAHWKGGLRRWEHGIGRTRTRLWVSEGRVSVMLNRHTAGWQLMVWRDASEWRERNCKLTTGKSTIARLLNLRYGSRKQAPRAGA